MEMYPPTSQQPKGMERHPDRRSIKDIDHRILVSHDGLKLNLGEGDQGEPGMRLVF